MKTFLAVVRVFVTTVALGVACVASFTACRFASDARDAAIDSHNSAIDKRTVTITVSITGTDASSKATAEKIVQRLKDLELKGVVAQPVQPPTSYSSFR